VTLKLLNKDFPMTDFMQGVFTAALLIGASVGSLFGGAYCDTFGRKIGIISVGAISTVGAIATALSNKLFLMMISRGVLGLAVGLATVVSPTYVSENAEDAKKGVLGTFFQLAITFGIFLSYLVALPFDNYKYMFGLAIVPGIICLIVGIVMPESPFWLARKSAERTPLIGSAKLLQPREDASYFDLFRPPHFKPFLIGLLLAVAQQLTGINAFMYYAPAIFSAANVKNDVAPTIGLGAWNFVTTFISTFLVDRLGRRPLLLVGTLIMTVSNLSLAIFNLALAGDKSALGALSIVFLLIFVLGFETGEGPLFWVVCAELFRPEIKGAGLSTLNALTWIFNLMLTLGFLPAQTALGQSGVFFIFGGTGLFCLILMYFILPETRTSTGQEIIPDQYVIQQVVGDS